MNEILSRIKEFYYRNRKLLIGVFAFLLLLQLCSRGAQAPSESQHKKRETIRIEVPEDTLSNGEESLEKAFYEGMTKPAEKQPEFNPLFMEFLLMTALVLIFYIVGKRGWLRKLMPAMVIIKARTVKSRAAGDLLLAIEINNKTKDSITFEPPILIFKRFRKVRKFKIKGGGGENVFPLTLMPDTGHKVIINLDRFKERIPEIKKYNKVNILITADNGKTYKVKPDSWFNFF